MIQGGDLFGVKLKNRIEIHIETISQIQIKDGIRL